MLRPCLVWPAPSPGSHAPQRELQTSREVPVPGLLPANPTHASGRNSPVWHGLPSVPALAHVGRCCSLALPSLLPTPIPGCQVGYCQLSSMIQLGLAYHCPSFLHKPRECYSSTEVSPQFPYRLCPQIQFSCVLVGATTLPDMAYSQLPTFMGEYYRLAEPGMSPSPRFCEYQSVVVDII